MFYHHQHQLKENDRNIFFFLSKFKGFLSLLSKFKPLCGNHHIVFLKRTAKIVQKLCSEQKVAALVESFAKLINILLLCKIAQSFLKPSCVR